MKKLLIVMPSLSRGGGERVVSVLSGAFAHHLDLVIAVFEQKPSYSYRGRIVNLNVPLSAGFQDRIVLFFKRLRKLKEVIVAERPDEVMSLGGSANLMSILAFRNPVVRVDMFISLGRKGFFGFVFKLLARILFHRAGRVIAVSQTIAKDLQERYGVSPKKLQIIYNPVDVEGIQKKAKEKIPLEYQEIFSHPIVVTMGRLTRQKGQWHLLRAFKEVKRRVPDAELISLGEGELRERLELLASELGIAESVYFLGWQENPFKYLARAKVFVLPSLWEGLPDVLLEALAAGLPVISSDCRSGPREILAPCSDIGRQTNQRERGEYGILLPVCDGKWRRGFAPLTVQEHTMAEAITHVLGDAQAQKNMRALSVQRARDFDIQTIIPQWRFLWEV